MSPPRLTSLAPIPWGGGPLAGWVVHPKNVGPREAREDSMRARLLAIVALGEQANPERELALWLTPLGAEPMMSFAAWLMTWALQRPLFLQAMMQGFDIAGLAVRALVQEVSAEAKGTLCIDLGLTFGSGDPGDGRLVVVRYRWPGSGFDPVVFVRAPRLAPEGWPTTTPLPPMPDAWRQEAHDFDFAPCAGEGDRLLAAFLPGRLDIGHAFEWPAVAAPPEAPAPPGPPEPAPPPPATPSSAPSAGRTPGSATPSGATDGPAPPASPPPAGAPGGRADAPSPGPGGSDEAARKPPPPPPTWKRGDRVLFGSSHATFDRLEAQRAVILWDTGEEQAVDPQALEAPCAGCQAIDDGADPYTPHSEHRPGAGAAARLAEGEVANLFVPQADVQCVLCRAWWTLPLAEVMDRFQGGCPNADPKRRAFGPQGEMRGNLPPLSDPCTGDRGALMVTELENDSKRPLLDYLRAAGRLGAPATPSGKPAPAADAAPKRRPSRAKKAEGH